LSGSHIQASGFAGGHDTQTTPSTPGGGSCMEYIKET